DSISHAEDDLDARRLREQKVEGERVLEAIRAALAADGEVLLEAAERTRIDQATEALAQACQGSDAQAIKAAIAHLEKSSSDYVARRMDASIRKAMAGHKVEEFK
ncbi:MAG: Hsp70 family protein, partial [Gammaproteobacteria bacterium]